MKHQEKPMKRIIAFTLVGLSFGAGYLFAQIGRHPNLASALDHLKQASGKITAAQKANEYDMDGHAAKAKTLIDQAISEVQQAASAAAH